MDRVVGQANALGSGKPRAMFKNRETPARKAFGNCAHMWRINRQWLCNNQLQDGRFVIAQLGHDQPHTNLPTLCALNALGTQRLQGTRNRPAERYSINDGNP